MSVIDSLSLGGTTYSLRDNDGRAIIAGTESSTTSAHAYSAGDYFILNDTLYEATASIAVGGTITVGTNCQATTVCGEVGELKSDFATNPFGGIEFVVPVGTEHSSATAKDQLKVNIKAGEKYRMIQSGGGTLYAYRPDGTAISGVAPKTGTASEDIAAFGVYRNNRSGTEPITVRMTLASNPMGADIYDQIGAVASLSDSVNVLNSTVTVLNSTVKDISGNTAIPLQYQGKSVNLSGSSVTMSGGVPQYSSTDATYDCGYISCSEGDVFTINGKGGVSARLYGFIASDGTILAASGESWTKTNLIVTAPANSAFLMLNNQKSDGRSSYVGELLSAKVNNLEKSTNYYSINNLEFVYGGIYNGSINTDTNRIHSVELLKVSKGTRIEFLGGFTGLVVAAYDQFGNYLANNPWSESWTITQDGYIRIVLRKSTSNAQIATSDFADLVSAVSVVYEFPSDYSKAMEYYWQASNVLNNLKKNATAEFVYFSDIHGGNINFNRIIEYAENGSIDAILNGGDTAQNYLNDNSHPITWYADGIDGSSVDILSAVGNHDVWDGAFWTKAQATDVYNAFIKPIVTKFTGVVQPENAETLGLCYYYKDYDSVRVIVLNAMSGAASVNFWDTTEANWLTSVLADAKSNSKHVLIVNHPPFQKTVAVRDIQNPWNSFLNYTTLSTYDDIYVTPDAVQIVQDFIDAGGVFIGWLSGHLHFDNVLTATGFDGQIMINIASAKYGNHPDGASYNDLDIKDYDCFNHIAVDTTTGLFKVMRVGWNTDYSLKTRNVFSYDYINKTILATS